MSKSTGPIQIGIAKMLRKVSGLVWIVLKRLWFYPGLTLLSLFGIVLVVGLITSASFFAQAVDKVILTTELAEIIESTGRPPLSVRFYNFPSGRRPLTLPDAELLSSDISETVAVEVGLPLKHVGVYVDSGGLMLQPGPGSELYGEAQKMLATVSLAYIEGVEEHLEIIEGKTMDRPAEGNGVEIWMHARLAQEMGPNIGEAFNIGVTMANARTPLRLAGIWQARDPSHPYWFSNPDTTFNNTLLMRRQDYIDTVQPMLPSQTRVANWHIILDDAQIIPANSRSYIAGFERAITIINKFLPDTQLNAPSRRALEQFVNREEALTVLLLGFNLPAYGILLYFLVLTANMIAHGQRREMTILMSRGMSASGMVGITLLEQGLLCVVGYPLGVGFGMILARQMGYTDSFLEVTARAPLPVSMQGFSLPLTLLALGVAMLARLWPAMQASRHSVVGQEQERIRPQRGPFWYRAYLDLLLIPLSLYAYDQLSKQGGLVLLVQDQPEVLFRDPLLILVPALFILTSGLILMRFFFVMMRLVDMLAGLIPWLTLHLALRQLGRQSHNYINPLLLVIIALALGVYSLSMAESLDRWLVDRIYYRVGADLAFAPFQARFAEEPMLDGEWIPPPEEFVALPGVTAATRTGNYRIELELAGNDVRGRFLALDRLTFPGVAWFRHDFSGETLGGLMNRLAASPQSILVSQTLLNQHNLRIGDTLNLEVSLNEDIDINAPFTIAGSYTYFPTVYHEDEITIIGNLDYFTLLLGITVPHDIWLKTEGETDPKGEGIFQAVRQLGLEPLAWQHSQALITEEKAKLERVGVFGTLSAGFLASILLASLGLLINSYASMRDRLHRFAVLNALGVTRRQIVGQVMLEYMLLLTYGAVVGAIIGIAASELFVPFFRAAGETGQPLPPLLPFIAREAVRNLTITFALSNSLIETALIYFALSQPLVGLLKGHWG